MEISERILRETFLPSWEAGIKKAGALGVMATYPAIDGVPAHASEKIMTGILREELGFEGLVLTEGSGIKTLLYEGIVATAKEAGQLTIKAGVDVAISFEAGYLQDMVESVTEGKVSLTTVDRTVRRVLVQKFKLGLFDNPYVDPKKAEKIVHTSEHQEIALQAGRESVVLLKNENNLLPLDKNISSIAVIGPNADHALNQLGDYTSHRISQEIITVLKGIRNVASKKTKVNYVKGCDIIGTKFNEIEKARQVAQKAEVAIVVVGENEWHQRDEDGNRIGTSGEGFDVASLDLTGIQPDLVKAVVETGTPTIVVLINGRPLSIRYIVDHVPAILESWISGEKGGQAIAEILFGDVNPSGKLPVTIPRHVGQLPVYYNAKKSKKHWLEEGWGNSYADMDYRPLFPFVYGLSYTTFEYSNLSFDRKEIGIAGSIIISVDITNTGDRFGQEIAQLYIQDKLSTVSTPYIELKGFKKVALDPKETKTITFKLNPEHLMLFNRNLERIVEPGEFKVMIGASSEDIRQQDSFWVK
jgi:beta-glucosidase